MNIANTIRNTPIPPIEIEILLAEVLNNDRSFLNSFPETTLTKKQEEKINNFVNRRLKNEPLPYILGYKEFYGRNFLVNKNVLIPRPETENLVEKVLKFSQGKRLSVADIGTGSGCIAVTLKLENPNLEITAIDLSEKALSVAKKNAALHDTKIRFLKSDLLDVINQSFDVIVANLPYIPTNNWKNLPEEIKNYEPRLALDSGNNSKTFYEKLFTQTKGKLNSNGLVVYELDGNITQVSAADLAETLPG